MREADAVPDSARLTTGGVDIPRWPGLLAAFLTIAAMVGAPAFADRTAPYAPILEGPAKSVVPVRYHLRPKERPEGGEGPKTRRVTVGTVVGKSGMVMINASTFPDPDSGPDVLEPTEFRILEEGREVAAEVAGLARDLNIAFIRPKDPGQLRAPSVDFAEAPRLALGEEVFIVCLLSEPQGFSPAIYRGHLNGQPGPGKAVFSLDTLLPDMCAGGLVLRQDNRPAGFVGIDLLPEAWDSGEAGNLLLLFGSANQGPRPGYLAVYPASLFAGLIAAPPPPPAEDRDQRGWLGITMQPLSRDLAEYWGIDGPGGVVLGAVLPGSPADEAGLKVGDVLIEVDGEPLPVREPRDLPIVQKKIRRAGSNRDVPVAVWRAGERRSVTVRLSAPPTTMDTAKEYKNDEYGVTVRELTYDLIQALNLAGDTRGVIVSKVERGGWAQVGGVELGDIVQKVDGADIADLGGFRAALDKARADKLAESLLLVLRSYKTRFIRVKTNWE